MNDVELVNLVFDGLINQGGCSKSSDGGCMYRGDGGRKCGAGLLIRDEDYKEIFENMLCHPRNVSVGREYEISMQISKLLTSYGYSPAKVAILQSVHDHIANGFPEVEHVERLARAKAEYLTGLSNGLDLMRIILSF